MINDTVDKRTAKQSPVDPQALQVNKNISKAFIKSFEAILKKPGDFHKLFFLFTKKLNKFFLISRASLILYSRNDHKLKAVAARGKNGAREGLALILPEKNSLLYGIFAEGKAYIACFPAQFPGNFIEEKILLDETARSLAIIPIGKNGSKDGLICLASPIPGAFAMIEDGVMDGLIENFAQNLNKRLSTIII